MIGGFIGKPIGGVSATNSFAALTVTLGAVALSSTAAVALKANASITLTDVTLASASVLPIKANESTTLADLALSSTAALLIAANLGVTLNDLATDITSPGLRGGAGKRRDFPSYLPQAPYAAKKNPPVQPIWDRYRRANQDRAIRVAVSQAPIPLPPASIFQAPRPVTYPMPGQTDPAQSQLIAQQSRDARDIADISDAMGVMTSDTQDAQDAIDILSIL